MTEIMTPSNMNRRRALQLGASGAVAVMTVRPGIAQAATSVLNCQIPIPEPSYAHWWIAADGTRVIANTPGAFPPAAAPFTGEQVKLALAGGVLPGTSSAQSAAYLAYIQRLQYGQLGYTCYASLQMPH
jgi:hypothetical protein